MQIYKEYKVPDTYTEIDDLNSIFNPEGIRLEKVQYIDFDKMTCTIVTVDYYKFRNAEGIDRDKIVNQYIDIVHKYIDSKVPDPKLLEETIVNENPVIEEVVSEEEEDTEDIQEENNEEIEEEEILSEEENEE